jgi:fermentation-respiration switch protein FrsA (DUF1100 family)
MLRRRPWIRLPLIALCAYGLVLGLLVLFEEKLIFYPSRYPAGDWTPHGIAAEDAWFEAADGTKLHGWFVPHTQPKAVVLVAHGNGGNITHRTDLLRALHRMQTSSMIFDYRGYGRSSGSPTGTGILEDARAARAWLAQRAGVAAENLVMFGESLGGAVAVRLASEGGARGLVVESSFCSLATVGAHHYPWAPIRLLLRTSLEPATWIRDYHGPLLQCHGDADRIVPFECGRRLFEAAHDPKEFVTLPGADHNDGMNDRFLGALAAFLSRI